MCGIAGIYVCSATESPVIRQEWLHALDAGVSHRGPDNHATLQLRTKRSDGTCVHLALVHHRLSIIDHETGAQPMTVRTADGDLTVVFNGCIYNHRALRRELEREGAKFRSDHSDTEVIPFAWRHWGWDGIRRLDGMFAFALFDHADGNLILARDQAGEKPLYRFERPYSNVFAFASSAAPLARIDFGITREDGGSTSSHIDPKSLTRWIRFGFGPETPFRHVKSMHPGTGCVIHAMKADRAPKLWESSEVRYARDSKSIANCAVSLDEVDSALSKAVVSRIEADTPVGCFLSGGIDSALVAALAAKAGHKLPTFTVRMPDKTLDESVEAAETARALGLPHHILDCESEPLRDLETLISQTGLPFADSSLLPSLWLSRAAKQQVKVALGGDGGDELFLGYDRQHAARWIAPIHHLGASNCLAMAKLLGVDAPARLRSRIARLCSAAIACEYEDLIAIFPRSLEFGALCAANEKLDAVPPCTSECAREFDLKSYLPDDLLRKTDSASMSVGLEVRSPLLASEVRELVAGIPTSELMRHGPKWILRRIAAKYLPRAIITRPKRGFAVPIGRWIRENRGDFSAFVGDMAASSDPWPTSTIGIEVDRKSAQRMYDQHRSGDKDHAQRLYSLAVLALWCRQLAAK